MNTMRLQTRLAVLAATAVTVVLAGVPGALAAPVKLVLADHFGREVNLTEVHAHAGPELENTCTVISGDVCQEATAGSTPGEFQASIDVAGAPNGNVYITDANNSRVQELTPTGGFVLMFGKERQRDDRWERLHPGRNPGLGCEMQSRYGRRRSGRATGTSDGGGRPVKWERVCHRWVLYGG